MIPQYDKKVLLVHGDKDGGVPISYSERAAQLYPSVKFEILSEAGHGF
ncbi:alpha/beta fold hydrolase [Eubacterium sp. 14-2]